MINEIAVENFRSLENKFVKLKPITVFVGSNSSGKSSLIRTLPLMRQSVESKTMGPILWFGRYVDFGAFGETVNRHNDSSTISFSYKLNLNYGLLNKKRFALPGIDLEETIDIIVKVEIEERDNKSTVLKSLAITFIDDSTDDFSFVIEFDNDKVQKISFHDVVIVSNDKEDTKSYTADIQTSFGLQKFLPRLLAKKKEKVFVDGEYVMLDKWTTQQFKKLFSDVSVKLIDSYFWSTTESHTIKEGLEKVGFVSNKDILNQYRKVFKKQKKFIQNIDKNEDDIVFFLRVSMLLYNFDDLVEQLDRILIESFNSVKYIAPIRATAQRFYRFQDLAVNEIDHEGSNIAMFIYSLSKGERKLFESWTLKHLGFIVKVQNEGLHYSLKIKFEDDENEFNLSDMGFGYSQTLPIIIMLWTEIYKLRRFLRRHTTKYIVIEQPELHLHPKFQAKMSNLFVNIIKYIEDKRLNIKIIFETHSNTMIDVLGEAIENEELSPNDVSVVIFDKKTPSSETKISESTFDENGYLQNWPIGFFSGNNYGY